MQIRVLIRKHRARVALAAVAALMVGVVSLTGWTLLDARKAVFRQAEQAAANLVLSLERDIARNIEIYDLSLKATAATGLFNAAESALLGPLCHTFEATCDV